MLTADLVRARRKGHELHLVPLGRLRERARELAALYLDLFAGCIGRTRGELESALGEIETAASERIIAAGLRKLIEDRCEFEAGSGLDAESVRREVFVKASLVRQAGTFDRAALLAEFAAARGVAADELERALYSDLRSQHRLQALRPTLPEWLVDHYERAQAQAVLLRAVRVEAEVTCASPAAARALFRKLKFLRLLHTIRPRDGGYHISIDGPYSLFDAVTKYGLQLALALPALQACEAWKIDADLRWGTRRDHLTLRLAGEKTAGDEASDDLPEESAQLLRAFRELDGPWRARPARAILELPGVGLCVPDLIFERDGGRVHLEVLGFWSRDAVWRRVELVEAGLKERILFAVSERLRVSEAALGDDLPAALYVFKGAMSARIVAERLDRLLGQRAKT